LKEAAPADRAVCLDQRLDIYQGPKNDLGGVARARVFFHETL
jgi:hypothetical protein